MTDLPAPRDEAPPDGAPGITRRGSDLSPLTVRILGVASGGAIQSLGEFGATDSRWVTLSVEVPAQFSEVRVVVNGTVAVVEFNRIECIQEGVTLADPPPIEVWPGGKDAVLIATAPARVCCLREGAGIRFPIHPRPGGEPVLLRGRLSAFIGPSACFEALGAIHESGLAMRRRSIGT